jgi:hypothetical protein
MASVLRLSQAILYMAWITKTHSASRCRVFPAARRTDPEQYTVVEEEKFATILRVAYPTRRVFRASDRYA